MVSERRRQKAAINCHNWTGPASQPAKPGVIQIIKLCSARHLFTSVIPFIKCVCPLWKCSSKTENGLFFALRRVRKESDKNGSSSSSHLPLIERSSLVYFNRGHTYGTAHSAGPLASDVNLGEHVNKQNKLAAWLAANISHH